ncbi:MAG: RsmD family RNA methyltransferase [Myxococcota bacterium]|nr:RsmD family RNA methyltransferase [Myxococcota bacterium]
MDETVEVATLAAGGDGVGRLADGRVVFVRLAAPGDRVRIREAEAGTSFLRATSFELIEPGEVRREPGCEVFGRCGGCAWQHVQRDAQLEARRGILHDAIRRIAKLETIPKIEMVVSPHEYGYRGRTRVVARGRAVGFRRFRAHAIEPVEHCPVLRPEVDAALAELAARVRAAPHADDPTGEREYELISASDGSVRCTSLEAAAEPAEASTSDETKVALDVAGHRVLLSPGGFAQANPSLFDAMFEAVSSALMGEDAEHLVELYAGSGFFTLGLAQHFDRVVAAEADASACRDLESNLAASAIHNVEVRCARVEDSLDAFANQRADAVLLDPPRAGLARGAAARLAALGARRIAYMSCDPATLARDLAVLCGEEGGYELRTLTAFDVFPQTPHVEALAVLESTKPA